nr:NS1 [Yonaguni orbivirus]
MDHFIRFFNVPSEDALYLRLSNTISMAWKCSHRNRECILYNQCIKENFEKVSQRALHLQDYTAAAQILKVAKMMMAVRGDLWCNAINYARKKPIPNAERERQEMTSSLIHAYNYSSFQEEVESLERVSDGPAPVYVDDSKSLIHSFFMPVSSESETKVTDVKRLGRFLLIFYDTMTLKTRVLWQQTPEAHDFVAEYLSWGMQHYPECLYTHSKRIAQWVVWLPDSMIDVMNDHIERASLLRILDMDLKLILSFDTKDPVRMCFQRFGIKGLSMQTINDLLLTQIGSRTLIELLLNRPVRTVIEASIPMIIIRGYIYGYYTSTEVKYWFDTNVDCQCCYIERHCAVKKILVLDSRASDILGRDPQRAGRLIKHQDGTLNLISSFDLHHGEMLSRQENHWIAFSCLDSADALLVAITVIHRYMRGNGLNDEFDKHIAMNILARCYLYWGPTDNHIVSAIFHLMCYLLLHKKLGIFFERIAWYDLGNFVTLICKTEKLHPCITEKMHAAVAKAAIFYLRMTVHGYDIGKEVTLGDANDVENAVKKLVKLPKISPITPKGTVKKVVTSKSTTVNDVNNNNINVIRRVHFDI